MREINVDVITNEIEKLCIKANCYLNSDIKESIYEAIKKEESENGKNVLENLLKNAQIAQEKEIAICQDTGMAVFFIEIGQEVHIVGGSLTDAINEGVRRGYENGFLRKSVVKDPITRKNTNDNTPAIIHYDIVMGDKIKIDFAPKGFGSENMSQIKMLKPSEGIEGIKNFVVETVSSAGANPCPPIVVGVGIGGTFEKAAYLSKKALLRPVDTINNDEFLNNLEIELLEKINSLGIGPAGFGGRITALKVNIERYPTHIAGLPVAVNISCHATRHATAVI